MVVLKSFECLPATKDVRRARETGSKERMETMMFDVYFV
jgi:hypothetical protein